MSHFLFQIGIFPWVAMAGTLLFLEPDWPRRAVRWTRSLFRRKVGAATVSAHV
jgi:hypothetical protein